MNQAAIIFGLIITAIISVGAFQTLLPNVSSVENSSMETELMNIVNASVAYRNTNRNDDSAFTGDVDELSTNGYLDSELYSDGVGESVLNTTITAAIEAPGTSSKITYDAGDEDSCNYLKQRADAGRIPNLSKTDGDHDCVNKVLTVTLRD